MRLHDGDSFKDKAICQRGEYDNRCACSTTDHCNDPKVKINSYVFTQNPVLEGYQWLPQIQPPMPPLQPVLPPVELPVPLENDHDMNETVAELESGVETDLLNDLDNETWIPRKDEKHEENLLTVTTTVGLNVRDHTSRVNNSIGQHLESTTGKRAKRVCQLAVIHIFQLHSRPGKRRGHQGHPGSHAHAITA
uniref:Uncharacterized protein n=1 Tax=Caenorhabditis japonica TaxID=281687 RepID=A0A8R1HKI3_CAEJA